MKPIGLGLAVALIVAALVPAAVISAPKTLPAISAEARKKGMTDAPTIAAAAGVTCKVTDARFVGKSVDAKTKIPTGFYEVDCDAGPGFLLSAPLGGKPAAFTCIEANSPQPDGKPAAVPCLLPGNADPKADLIPLIAKAAVICTPEAARGIGQTSTNTFLEVSCVGGYGYVLQAGAPANLSSPVSANDCLGFDQAGGNIKCSIHDPASRLAVIDTYAKAANNGCAVKEKRFVGMTVGGTSYFETACQDGKGYMLKVDNAQLTGAIPCERATVILGGCELSAAKEAETAQAGLYTKLSKAAGFNCDVAKYAPFPSPPGKDVVELACSNRPDGAVVIFGGPNDKSDVYDCARAPMVGYRCSFSKPTFEAVTADLKTLGKTTCTVSNVRVIGKSEKGTTYLETACSDGLKGYIVEYGAKLAPLTAIGCAFTKDCKLPGNT